MLISRSWIVTLPEFADGALLAGAEEFDIFLDAGKGGVRPAVLGYHLKADAVVLAISNRSDSGDYVVADAVWWEPRPWAHATTTRDSLSR